MKCPKKSLPKRIEKYIQVNRSKVISKSTGREIICKYSDVPSDDYGWVQDMHYRPISFDLCSLRIIGSSRPVPGWWEVYKWNGLNFKKDYKVIAWKRIIEYD